MTPVSVAKSEGRNEVVLSYDLQPSNVIPYESADWKLLVTLTSHDMTLTQAALDADGTRLRLTFSYNENLQGADITLIVDPSLVSPSISAPVSSVSVVGNSNNNQALNVYEDSTY